MNPEEFPELPKIEVENGIEVEQINLKNMIKKTIFAEVWKKVDQFLQDVYLK